MNAGGLTEMEFSNDGTLYGIDNQNKRIISIDLKSETVITVAGLPWGSYCGLAIAPDDTLFISDSISRSIIQYDKFGNKLNMFNYMSINPVLGLEFAPSNVPIPEPSSLLLCGIGIGAIWFRKNFRVNGAHNPFIPERKVQDWF